MPFCPNCGTQNPDGTAFCYNCGTSMSQQPPVQNQPPMMGQVASGAPAYETPAAPSYPVNQPAELPTPAKVTGIISMVCGIVSCCSCYTGFVFSIAAFITGAISNSKNPMGLENKKVVVGRITAIVGIVISVISLIVYIALLEEAMSYSYYDFY